MKKNGQRYKLWIKNGRKSSHCYKEHHFDCSMSPKKCRCECHKTDRQVMIDPSYTEETLEKEEQRREVYNPAPVRCYLHSLAF